MGDVKKKFRKHIRLKGFDYGSGHYYFVTICTRDWKRFFAPRVFNRYKHCLPDFVAAGPWPAQHAANADIVEENLLDLENKFDLGLDFYCLMPTHLHLIVALGQARRGRAATGDAKPTALPWVINALKGWCTRRFGRIIWQPNYYEHIIRSESSLDKIRKYILRNPWVEYEEINWKKLDLPV